MVGLGNDPVFLLGLPGKDLCFRGVLLLFVSRLGKAWIICWSIDIFNLKKEFTLQNTSNTACTPNPYERFWLLKWPFVLLSKSSKKFFQVPALIFLFPGEPNIHVPQNCFLPAKKRGWLVQWMRFFSVWWFLVGFLLWTNVGSTSQISSWTLSESLPWNDWTGVAYLRDSNPVVYSANWEKCVFFCGGREKPRGRSLPVLDFATVRCLEQVYQLVLSQMVV